MPVWHSKHVYGVSDQETDFVEKTMQDDVFVENLLYNDELSFEEAAFLNGYYLDIQESFS